MKNFDKKLLIIFIFLFIIICISIYFFTKDDQVETVFQNEFYISPNSTENQNTTAEIIVHIDGEVAKPGIVYLPTEARITDAISAAGGLTELADTSKINLAYSLQDGQKVYIPSINDTQVETYIQNDAGDNVIVQDSSSSSLININSATQSKLDSLPGIGPSTASKIIDYRNKNGDFKNIEDLMNVSGIGEAKFNNIRDYICI